MDRSEQGDVETNLVPGSSGDGKLVMSWLPSPIGGIPCVQQGFMDSFFQFLTHDAQRDNPIFGGYLTNHVGYIASGRDVLVQTYLERTDAEWLLMLDWDVLFNPQHVYDLLDAADPVDRPIISGCYVTYFGEDNALRPCWMSIGEPTADEPFQPIPVTEFKPHKIVPLNVVGMGFTLMHRSALLKIAEVYAHEPQKWFDHDVINGTKTGEDVSFCHRAIKSGLSVWGHGGVMLGHMKCKILEASDMLNPVFARSVGPRVDKTVLSVGAGGHPNCPGFEGWKVVTLDIDEETDPDICMDARDLRWADEMEDSYDGCYSSHTIEHFTQEDAVFVARGMYRVLKPGGRLVIRCPNMEAVERAIAAGADWEDFAYTSPSGPIKFSDMRDGWSVATKDNPYMRHHSGWDRRSLERMLRQAGFDKVIARSQTFELEVTAIKGTGNGELPDLVESAAEQMLAGK